MGNVMKQHILEIFNSSAYHSARVVHDRGERHTMHLCDTCDVPETNRAGALSMKITPDGKMISNNAFQAFDNDKAKKSLREEVEVAVQ